MACTAHLIYSEWFTRNSIQINIGKKKARYNGTTLLSTYENGGRWRYLLNEKYCHFIENVVLYAVRTVHIKSGAITSKMDVNTYIMTPIQSAAVYTSVDRIVLFRTSQQIKNENFRKMSEKRTNEKKYSCLHMPYASSDQWSLMVLNAPRETRKKTNQPTTIWVRSSMHCHNEI